MKHKKFDFRTAYIDLLLNVLTGIIFLFILTTIFIQPPKKTESEGIKRNAELIITATWDTMIDCDIDMWIKDPLGNIVSFQQLSKGLMTIERDDMGFKNDFLYDMNGELLLKAMENKEIWTLRGKQVGEFTLNLHMYSCRVKNVPLQLGAPYEVTVIVELIRLNPTYVTVKKELIVFKSVWEEVTVFNFKVSEEGGITFQKDFRKLVKDKKAQ
jgi:hypothetical protein